MVRPATIADISALMSLGQLFFDESGMAEVMEYDAASAEKTFHALIQVDTAEVFVLEQAGSVVGAIGGTVTPFYFNNTSLCAQEFFWFVHPEYRGTVASAKLVPILEAWARDKGAVVMDMAATVNSPATVLAFYRKRGYLEQETHFMRRL